MRRTHPRDLSPETLVRRLRESKRKSDAAKLLAILKLRLRGYCKRHISRKFRLAVSEEITDRVEHAILLDIVHGKTEHLEGRFFLVVNHKIIDVVRTVQSQEEELALYAERAKDMQIAELPWVEQRLTEKLDEESALSVLSPRALHAVVLHRLGVPISSKDHSATTMSGLLGCSTKSVHRLLASAEKEMRSRLSHSPESDR